MSTRSSERNGLRFGTRRNIGLAAAAVVAIVAGVVALSAFLLLGSDGTDGPPRAVIIDQLELTVPNPDFAREATAQLEAAGYRVDYVPGADVTVDYYRELPKRGYDLVLVRAHAGRHQAADGEFTEETALFSAEPYSTSAHVQEQRDGRVTQVLYNEEDEETYFGVAPAFVRHSMKGDFGDAVVVLMGCDVLRGEQLAKSFVNKGAGVVVGWDGPVSADHTDAATLRLLQAWLGGGVSVQEAAAAVMNELGPDPYYGASLLAEPPLVAGR
jgi:hypothetical protein